MAFRRRTKAMIEAMMMKATMTMAADAGISSTADGSSDMETRKMRILNENDNEVNMENRSMKMDFENDNGNFENG